MKSYLFFFTSIIGICFSSCVNNTHQPSKDFIEIINSVEKKFTATNDTATYATTLDSVTKIISTEKQNTVLPLLNSQWAKYYLLINNSIKANEQCNLGLAEIGKTKPYDAPTHLQLLLSKAKVYDLLNQNDSSLLMTIQALDIANKNNLPQVAQICLLAANVYNNMSRGNEALEYLHKGLNYATTAVDSFEIGYKMASIFTANDQIDSALHYLKYTSINNTKDSNLIAKRLFSIGVVYSRKNQSDTALKYYDSSYRFYKKFASNYPAYYYSSASDFKNLKQFKKSESYLDTAMELAKKADNKDVISRVWLVRRDIAIVNKNFPLAYSMLDSARDADWDLMDADMAKKTKDLEAKYNGQLNQKTIEQLNTEVVSKSKSIQQRTAIAIALLLLLAALGYIYHLKTQKNQLVLNTEKITLEQRLLLSQMNPHFMFNALSAIQNEIISGNTKIATQYLNKYAELTRLILESSRVNKIPLVNEIKILENYLLLQKIRFSDKFEYKINVFENYEDYGITIPPMLIQPFVENAIEHGFSNINYIGNLIINLKLENDNLQCSIIDNGKGLQPKNKDVKKISQSTQITKERLNHYSKSDLQIINIADIDNSKTGVEIILTIPI